MERGVLAGRAPPPAAGADAARASSSFHAHSPPAKHQSCDACTATRIPTAPDDALFPRTLNAASKTATCRKASPPLLLPPSPPARRAAFSRDRHSSHKSFLFPLSPRAEKTASQLSRTTVPSGRPRSHLTMQKQAPLRALVRRTTPTKPSFCFAGRPVLAAAYACARVEPRPGRALELARAPRSRKEARCLHNSPAHAARPS